MNGGGVRPITILIAALGGEGGSVLTDWIVAAATRRGFPVQSTSIPGVAQRTGATTYYIEIVPVPARELVSGQPVLALAPGVGDVDIVLASELLEAGRCVTSGFVTTDRTLTIASTGRSYLVVEKMAMGDGRYDSARLRKAIADNARAQLLIDMEALAKRSGAMVNAVMLGLLAGSSRLPFAPDEFEAAIRADGKTVEQNLSGFRAGLAAARDATSPGPVAEAGRRTAAPSPLTEIERLIGDLPFGAREVARTGVARLIAYQDVAYARRYLDRLAPIRAADERAGGRLLAEVARQLAVRMSYEDVIRVAQAKIDPARVARIASEMGAGPDEPVTVTEFLKPGIEEFCSVLPPAMAKRILATAERRGWLGRVHWGMEVHTTSINGFLRFWLLAKLRRWRPRSYRFAEEQRVIDAWLACIVEAARLSGGLALEIAECARLIKGYGDTHKRGSANWRLIEERIVRPALMGRIPPDLAADAVASARTAALADPEGEALARCLAQVEQAAPMRMAAE